MAPVDMRLTLRAESERYPIMGRFTIARGSKTEAEVITVTLTDPEGRAGRGECVPYKRYGESLERTLKELERAQSKIEAGIDLAELQRFMPAGAARNAVDCALWDLRAKQSGIPVWRALGLETPKPLVTCYTISLGTPEEMRSKAREAAHRPVLKIKLGSREDRDDQKRIRAVREGAPNARLIADANEGWTVDNVEENLRVCAEEGFELIEQPLPVAEDEYLRTIDRPVLLCADESVHDRSGLDRLVGLYDDVNVKLDKTGGLTEAFELTKAAREKGLGLMIGCMVGTSLAMAPALLLGAEARFVDLDGPLLLARDREDGLRYNGSQIEPAPSSLWG